MWNGPQYRMVPEGRDRLARNHVASRTEELDALAILRLLRATPLTERQRQVLDCRSQGNSYAAAGRLLNISGERVRQIEARLRTMAHRMSQEIS
jgi:DNA-binding CsgD family transcriptional regulator